MTPAVWLGKSKRSAARGPRERGAYNLSSAIEWEGCTLEQLCMFWGEIVMGPACLFQQAMEEEMAELAASSPPAEAAGHLSRHDSAADMAQPARAGGRRPACPHWHASLAGCPRPQNALAAACTLRKLELPFLRGAASCFGRTS